MTALLCALLCTGACVRVEPDKKPDTVTPDPDPDPEPEPQPDPEPDKKEADWKSYKKVPEFPSVHITCPSSIQKGVYTAATITVKDPEGMYCDVPELSASMQIKGRGNTTWGNPKKPYTIKLDERAKMLGMKNNKDWVLLANYSDKSLLRNTVAMEISRICDMAWSPRCRAVDLYLNGSYQGTYDLFQKVEVAKEKVDLAVVTENDNSGEALTGDYFLEIDTTQDEPVSFTTSTYGLPVMFKDPKYPTSQQQKYVKEYIASAEAALASSDYRDAEKGYRKYIDTDSFIKYYIVQELTKNVDGGLRKSSFMSLHRNGKLEISALWDFDLALGNANYLTDKTLGNHEKGSNGPEGWWVRYYCRSGKSECWYSRLFTDPEFTAALKAKWNELKPELDRVPDMIDALAQLNEDSYSRNFQKWQIIGTYVWPNVVYPDTYDKELDYLKDFYIRRLAWLDSEINAL